MFNLGDRQRKFSKWVINTSTREKSLVSSLPYGCQGPLCGNLVILPWGLGSESVSHHNIRSLCRCTNTLGCSLSACHRRGDTACPHRLPPRCCLFRNTLTRPAVANCPNYCHCEFGFSLQGSPDLLLSVDQWVRMKSCEGVQERRCRGPEAGPDVPSVDRGPRLHVVECL